MVSHYKGLDFLSPDVINTLVLPELDRAVTKVWAEDATYIDTIPKYASVKSKPKKKLHLDCQSGTRLNELALSVEADKPETADLSWTKNQGSQIHLAGPHVIKKWAQKQLFYHTRPIQQIQRNRILSAETFDYKRFLPYEGGLFCQKLFGKLYHGKQLARRHSLAYVQFPNSVMHIWYLKGTVCHISRLLNVKRRLLERLVYTRSYSHAPETSFESPTAYNTMSTVLMPNVAVFQSQTQWKQKHHPYVGYHFSSHCWSTNTANCSILKRNKAQKKNLTSCLDAWKNQLMLLDLEFFKNGNGGVATSNNTMTTFQPYPLMDVNTAWIKFYKSPLMCNESLPTWMNIGQSHINAHYAKLAQRWRTYQKYGIQTYSNTTVKETSFNAVFEALYHPSHNWYETSALTPILNLFYRSISQKAYQTSKLRQNVYGYLNKFLQPSIEQIGHDPGLDFSPYTKKTIVSTWPRQFLDDIAFQVPRDFFYKFESHTEIKAPSFDWKQHQQLRIADDLWHENYIQEKSRFLSSQKNLPKDLRYEFSIIWFDDRWVLETYENRFPENNFYAIMHNRMVFNFLNFRHSPRDKTLFVRNQNWVQRHIPGVRMKQLVWLNQDLFRVDFPKPPTVVEKRTTPKNPVFKYLEDIDALDNFYKDGGLGEPFVFNQLSKTLKPRYGKKGKWWFAYKTNVVKNHPYKSFPYNPFAAIITITKPEYISKSRQVSGKKERVAENVEERQRRLVAFLRKRRWDHIFMLLNMFPRIPLSELMEPMSPWEQTTMISIKKYGCQLPYSLWRWVSSEIGNQFGINNTNPRLLPFLLAKRKPLLSVYFIEFLKRFNGNLTYYRLTTLLDRDWDTYLQMHLSFLALANEQWLVNTRLSNIASMGFPTVEAICMSVLEKTGFMLQLSKHSEPLNINAVLTIASKCDLNLDSIGLEIPKDNNPTTVEFQRRVRCLIKTNIKDLCQTICQRICTQSEHNLSLREYFKPGPPEQLVDPIPCESRAHVHLALFSLLQKNFILQTIKQQSKALAHWNQASACQIGHQKKNKNKNNTDKTDLLVAKQNLILTFLYRVPNHLDLPLGESKSKNSVLKNKYCRWYRMTLQNSKPFVPYDTTLWHYNPGIGPFVSQPCPLSFLHKGYLCFSQQSMHIELLTYDSSVSKHTNMLVPRSEIKPFEVVRKYYDDEAKWIATELLTAYRSVSNRHANAKPSERKPLALPCVNYAFEMLQLAVCQTWNDDCHMRWWQTSQSIYEKRTVSTVPQRLSQSEIYAHHKSLFDLQYKPFLRRYPEFIRNKPCVWPQLTIFRNIRAYDTIIHAIGLPPTVMAVAQAAYAERCFSEEIDNTGSRPIELQCGRLEDPHYRHDSQKALHVSGPYKRYHHELQQEVTYLSGVLTLVLPSLPEALRKNTKDHAEREKLKPEPYRLGHHVSRWKPTLSKLDSEFLQESFPNFDRYLQLNWLPEPRVDSPWLRSYNGQLLQRWFRKIWRSRYMKIASDTQSYMTKRGIRWKLKWTTHKKLTNNSLFGRYEYEISKLTKNYTLKPWTIEPRLKNADQRGNLWDDEIKDMDPKERPLYRRIRKRNRTKAVVLVFPALLISKLRANTSISWNRSIGMVHCKWTKKQKYAQKRLLLKYAKKRKRINKQKLYQVTSDYMSHIEDYETRNIFTFYKSHPFYKDIFTQHEIVTIARSEFRDQLRQNVDLEVFSKPLEPSGTNYRNKFFRMPNPLLMSHSVFPATKSTIMLDDNLVTPTYALEQINTFHLPPNKKSLLGFKSEVLRTTLRSPSKPFLNGYAGDFSYERFNLRVRYLAYIQFFDAIREVKEFLSWTFRKRALRCRQLRAVENFASGNVQPSWMTMRRCPILSPDLRPMMIEPNSQTISSDLNKLYEPVVTISNRLHRGLTVIAECSDDSKPIESAYHSSEIKTTHQSTFYQYPYYTRRVDAHGIEAWWCALTQTKLQVAMDHLIQNGRGSRPALTGLTNPRPLKSLSDILKGKKGRFRQNLLGKRVDYSGRSVIVVAPELKLHQCGLPWEMAIVLFQPFLIRDLIQKGVTTTFSMAKYYIRKRFPVVADLLRELLLCRPILLNRAPTLHRLGVQAFQGQLISGRAILLHPLVCGAFNADFDGDQMAVHIPLGHQACAESWTLMWSQNHIVSIATGEVVPVPSQDMVLGCYSLTTEDVASRYMWLIGQRDALVHKTDMALSQWDGQMFTSYTQIHTICQTCILPYTTIIWLKWQHFECQNRQQDTLELNIDIHGHIVDYHPDYKVYTYHYISSHYLKTTLGRAIMNEGINNILSLNVIV